MKRTSLPLQRREFITLLGGAALGQWQRGPQQGEPIRRIGVLSGSGGCGSIRTLESERCHGGWVLPLFQNGAV